MKLNELVKKVQQTVDENKDKWLPSVNPSAPYYFSKEQRDTLYAPFAKDIDADEILNINKTMWDSGMPYRLHNEVADAVAIGLYMQCRTKDERDAMAAKFDTKTDEIRDVNLRLNRIPKGKHEGIDTRLGTYDKIEFIQKFGTMYNSTGEANADANDKSGICPLLMAVLNSGWHNIMAVVENGNVVVKERATDGGVTATTMILAIKVAFDTISKRGLIKSSLQASKHKMLFLGLAFHRMERHSDNFYADVKCDEESLYYFMENLLSNETIYSQDVFDFKTLNAAYLDILRNARDIGLAFNETNVPMVRTLVINTLHNMDELANIECRIIKEQQMRDPETNEFVKPRFSPHYLLYTIALGTMLRKILFKSYEVLRLDDFGGAYYDEGTDHFLMSWSEADQAKECVNRSNDLNSASINAKQYLEDAGKLKFA